VFENKVPEKLFILLGALSQSGQLRGHPVRLTSLALDLFFLVCIKETVDKTSLNLQQPQ
jgi:hypothetical protein